MPVDAYVIRSQRNKGRRAPSTIPHIAQQDFSKPGELLEDTDELNFSTQSKLRLVKPRHHLGCLSTGALIMNRVVGTGIFVAPPVVLAITGSKGFSLVLWLVGGIIAWAGLMVYLEYGIRFPLTGGELHYIDFVWLRPKLLMTYMFSAMFILLSGSQSNALTFGASVLQASSPEDVKLDRRLQKFFAVLVVGVVCWLQSISRINYVRFSNIFAIYKVTFLLTLTIIGWCALGQRRAPIAAATNDPYGIVNLRNSFKGSTSQPYAIALALLDIMRVYSGYENANFVLEEVRRPPKHEDRVFRWSAKFTMAMICFFYLMINVSLFAACTTEELLQTSDVLSLFFTKVFGPSYRTRVASGTLLAISSAGNIMSTTFAGVRVKQEIARLGVLPWPDFWAKSTRLNTPGPALLLHWIFSMAVIVATPLDSANGYLVFSTLYCYARTVIGIVLGCALLFAARLEAFQLDGKPWGSSRSVLSRCAVYGQTAVFILANFFVFLMFWFPASLQSTLNTKARLVPSFVGPVIAMCCFALGAILWLWDVHIAPMLGYRTEALQETKDGLDIHMSFNRHIFGFAGWILATYQSWMVRIKRPWTERGKGDDGDSTVKV